MFSRSKMILDLVQSQTSTSKDDRVDKATTNIVEDDSINTRRSTHNVDLDNETPTDMVQDHSANSETSTRQDDYDQVSINMNNDAAPIDVIMLSDVTDKPENQRYSNAADFFNQIASTSDYSKGNSQERGSDANFEESDVDMSDQDPTFKLEKKMKRVLVYPQSRRSSTSSSSSSSCSSSCSKSSSSESSSSDSSDSDKEPSAENSSSAQTIHTENVDITVTDLPREPEPIERPETVTKDGELTMEDPESTTRPEPVIEIVTTEREESIEETELRKKGRKRPKNPDNWKQNKCKKLRNTGNAYDTKKNTTTEARQIKPPCNEKCKLKCFDKVTFIQRKSIFETFWKLGEINSQRSFIASCMSDITPRYRYTNAMRPRQCNKAFHFVVEGKLVRICKTFFMQTLDITDRVIRTVKDKTDQNGFLKNDQRGKHSNHKKTDDALIFDIKMFINTIPRIESHYTRQTSSREYIDGGKTIMDLYRDFNEEQEKNKKPTAKYCTFYKVFTEQFNIAFFCPRKDQCDFCLQFQNSTPEQKSIMQEKIDAHLEEKKLSRQEKHSDRCKIDAKNKVLVFDLQAVLQSPRGDTSAFYYKSKLNSYNFTIAHLNNKNDAQPRNAYSDVQCFFWNETDAKRGANEIGSCLLKCFEKLSSESGDDDGLNLILFSDNCGGQNKNKFIVALYLYAVTHLNIKSITHKFLIKGHTQNEGDNVHSLIEKEIKKNLKSGPIYCPHQYVTIIKRAKKAGQKFNVHELTYESFFDLKQLQEESGYNFNKTTDGNTILWNDIKIIKVMKSAPFSFFVKSSYMEEDFAEVCIRNKRKKCLPISELTLKKAYSGKQNLSANKKNDLRELLTKNLIPNFYADFYNSIL